jgi:hypothetical protein
VTEEVGSFTGPYVDMLRVPNFIELVDKTVPKGETWDEQFETEKDEIRQQLVATRELQQRMDYMQHLMAQANEEALIQKDYDRVFAILGLDDTATTSAGTSATESPLPVDVSTPSEQQAEEAEQAVETPIVIPEEAPEPVEEPTPKSE